MTIEERIARHKAVTQYTMYASLLFGLWFIAEYLYIVYTMGGNPIYTIMRVPLSLLTPVLLFFIVKRIRDIFYQGHGFRRLRGWFLCMQVMFLAGMIEAMGLIVYNKWIDPDNLVTMHAMQETENENLINQVDQQLQSGAVNGSIRTAMESMQTVLKQNLNALKDMDILTPFEAGVGQLSNDVMLGMLIGIPICLILYRKDTENDRFTPQE